MTAMNSYTRSATRSGRSGDSISSPIIRELSSAELLALRLMYSERENSVRTARPKPTIRRFSWEH